MNDWLAIRQLEIMGLCFVVVVSYLVLATVLSSDQAQPVEARAWWHLNGTAECWFTVGEVRCGGPRPQE